MGPPINEEDAGFQFPQQQSQGSQNEFFGHDITQRKAENGEITGIMAEQVCPYTPALFPSTYSGHRSLFSNKLKHFNSSNKHSISSSLRLVLWSPSKLPALAPTVEPTGGFRARWPVDLQPTSKTPWVNLATLQALTWVLMVSRRPSLVVMAAGIVSMLSTKMAAANLMHRPVPSLFPQHKIVMKMALPPLPGLTEAIRGKFLALIPPGVSVSRDIALP
jgi:hypothetical protein